MTVITLSDNDDTYQALEAGDTILGIGGADTLTATTGGNRLYGGDGSDTLYGGIGNDYLQGDDLNNWNGKNTLFGDAGDDYILSNSDRDQVDAGSGNDTVEVSRMKSGQVFKGGAGDDWLVLNAQERSFHLFDFSSSFTVMEGIDVSSAKFTGFERLSFIGGQASYNVLASEKDDLLILNNLKNTTFTAGSLDGRGGNDSFILHGLTEGGTEVIDGGNGLDILDWNQGTMAVTDLSVDVAGGAISGDGSTFVSFTSIERSNIAAANILGHFAYQGAAGGDSVSFGGITASVRSGAGDDAIFIGATNATVNAGSGDDSIASSTNVAAKAAISAGDGDDIVGMASRGTANGDAGEDTLRATYNRASLNGGTGDDKLFRQAGFLDESSSNATLDGGAGTDTLTLTFNTVFKTIRADFSQASVTLYDGSIATSCEIVVYGGGSGKDIITSSNFAGGAAFNIVSGGFGDDRLTAAAAGATLDGGMGNNEMIGGAGDDILKAGIGGTNTFSGGGGNDRISGGAGIDDMRGGKGADVFHCGSTPTASGDFPRDTILDFSRSQGDKIDLVPYDANSTTVGVDEAFTFRGVQAFTGTPGQLRYEQIDNSGTDNDYTLLTGDVNGDGNADFVIELTGLLALRASDFML